MVGSFVMYRLACLVLLVGCASAGDGTDVPVDAPAGSDPDGSGEHPDGSSACDSKLGMLGVDFEGGAAGFTHALMDGADDVEPDWPYDDWEVGKATSGPGSCHGGNGCWATKLDNNYTSCQRAELVSPAFDLSSCTGRDVKLSFWSWHDFWTGSYNGTTWFDGGIVEISTDGTTWSAVTPMPAYPGTVDINPNMGSSYACVLPTSFRVDGKQGFVGNGGGWKLITIPVPSAMLTSTFRLRFIYGSGVSYASTNPETDRQHTRPGWYIDEIAFSAL